MIIEKYIIHFWQGKLKLWQSFWLVGGLVGIIIGQILIFLKEFIFSNYAQNPNDFPIGIKLLILVWIFYSTVGIWRSSENYKGYYFWKISTKIYIIINAISSFLLLFFFSFSEINNF